MVIDITNRISVKGMEGQGNYIQKYIQKYRAFQSSLLTNDGNSMQTLFFLCILNWQLV